MAALRDARIVPCPACGAIVCSCHADARNAADTLLRTCKTLDWVKTQKLLQALEGHRNDLAPLIEALLQHQEGRTP